MEMALRGIVVCNRHELEAFPGCRFADLHPGNIFVARQVAVLCARCHPGAGCGPA